MPAHCLKTITRFSILLLLSFFTLSNPVSADSTPKNESEYALIINSYPESSEWSNSFIYPVYKSLALDSANIAIYTEHMSTLTINDERKLQEYKNDLFAKYGHKNPRIIMLVGNTAWGILRKEIETRWADTPVLLCVEDSFMGPDNAYIDKFAITKEQRVPLTSYDGVLDITILHSPIYIRQTVELMTKMIPNMDKIIFLSDNRQISAQNRLNLENVIKKHYPNIAINNLISDQTSKTELSDILKHTPKTTGILYFSWFKKNTLAGNTVVTTNEYKMFSHYTNLPIFTLADNSTGLAGMVGGYFSDNDTKSSIVINTFRNILANDNRIKNTNIICGSPTPHFHYPALISKGIPIKLCPKNTVFFSKELTMWEKYKYQILSWLFCTISVFLFMLMRLSTLHKTKQRQIEKLLLTQNYSSLFENMPISYSKQKLEYDENGEISNYHVIETNPCFETCFANYDILSSQKSDIKLTELYKRAIKENKAITNQYYHCASQRYFSVIIVPSKVAGYMDVFYIENTELASAQQLLHTLNYKLSMALDVANITPWRWDLDKGIIMCDTSRATTSAAESTELSVTYQEYFSKISSRDIDRVKAAYHDLISGKTNKIKEEYRVFRNTSKLRYEWVETQAIVDKKDENGIPLSLIGSSLVISDRKKIESDLIEAKNKAEESNRLKSAFLANMSHEIRTPLNAIVGFSEVLATAEDKEEKQEYVSIIENNNTLLLQLINDILDLSKIEAGTLEFNYVDTDIESLFTELHIAFKMRMGESSVDIVYDNEGNNPIVINTDKNRLTQVITNMVNNAMKFTKQGSINFGYKFKNKKTLYFYVTDTGCGIPKENIDNVFGRFVKLNNFVQGTGLGLSICQTIIHNMGGEIGVESEEGVGSTFWFTLPYESGIIIEQPEVNIIQTPVEKKKLSVLIAEDNSSNFKLFEAILKNEYIIHHAWDGEEAVKMYKEHTPHIILMDINMPKLNGHEAIKQIRKISATVPIIAVTAHAFSADEKMIMNTGFNGYVAKPIDSKRLKSQMINLLKRQLIFI